MKPWSWLLMLGCVGLSAAASAESGSWSGSSIGGRVSVGQQILVSRPIGPAAPLPAAATISTLTWRISLLNPPPPGLQIKLCAQAVCFPLQGLSGTLRLSTARTANDVFRFIYSVNSRGPLMPVLQVVNNQLTVNYH
jgi:flagellar protein FlhE